jgi:hypothetical protein
MSRQETDEPYSYDGQLVFNGLYVTDLLEPDIDFEQVAEEDLSDFEIGDPENPSDGYELLEFSRYASESQFLSKKLEQSVDQVQAIRRKYEKWDEREDPTGEATDVRDVKHYDIYWDHPDYLFIKGNKTQADRASEIIEFTFGSYLTSREIEFRPDFLLWVFYQFKSGSSDLNDSVGINLLSDAEIQGEQEDRYGKRSRVDKSTDITKSTTVLIGLLRGKDLTRLEGVFEVEDEFVKANIEVGGRVHVKASHSIEGAEKIHRMSLAITFLREFISLFEYWEELPSEQKYPPLEFFEELYDECEKQGAEVTFPYDDVVETYRQKRMSGAEKEKQSGLSEFS